MLKGMARLTSRAREVDPGRFLCTETKAAQSLAASQGSQVPAERPRALSRTSENDPARHEEQHEGQHYRVPLQDLETVFSHGLPPRFLKQVLERAGPAGAGAKQNSKR